MTDTESMAGDGALGKLESSAGTVTLDSTEDAAVLRVEGALDLALAPKLQQLADRAMRTHHRLVVIDLTGVEFLASAGMAVLVRAQRQCAEGTDLRVVAASRITLRPLELTRLTDVLSVFPSMSAALADT